MADFVSDGETPCIAIRANLTRSKDGITPGGLERQSRRRKIPLHPELIRLGLPAYVSAIANEKHPMLFPELYQKGQVKKGGERFYARAGRHLLDYVDAIDPLLRASSSKRADLHSMRTTGASVLEGTDAKQLFVDDIMGHARSGTGLRKDSRLVQTAGLEPVLAKRLRLMMDAMPDVTSHLQPHPVRLLPVASRSRTGSAPEVLARRRSQAEDRQPLKKGA